MTKLMMTMIAFVTLFMWAVFAKTGMQAQGGLTPQAYLPIVLSAEACAGSSNLIYTSGIAYQFDTDNPVRPAYNHADKNIELRGYSTNTASNLQKELIDYGSGDPTQPPQFATLFSPYQVPPLSGFHQVHQWNWASSPTPGQPAGPITAPKVTALSFNLDSGVPLYAPISGYDIGGGVEVIVIFADENTVTLHYTREDSAAKGYTVHIDQICTDPSLLSLYNSLDQSNGARYDYPSAEYNLPTLAAGQAFGTTSANDMVVAIADTGAYQDLRSCNEWWQIRPAYGGVCPAAQ
ncbi:MAG: hypothetical protein ACI9EW_000884 [Cellvibrionaceae bacterium]|jgi:hypothetical protein